MGIRRKGDFIVWKVTIPARLATEIEMAIVDTVRQKPIYGLRSQLITELLMRHLQQLKGETYEQRS